MTFKRTKTKPKSQHLNVRLQKEQFNALHAKAAPDGGVSVVVREMVAAYLEGRMFIQTKPTSLNPST